MDWQGVPMGMIRHDELLNALLAIWKTQHGIAQRGHSGQCSAEYLAGFEEALEAVAQVAGLCDAFEIGKATHRTKSQARTNGKLEIIDSQARLVEY